MSQPTPMLVSIPIIQNTVVWRVNLEFQGLIALPILTSLLNGAIFLLLQGHTHLMVKTGIVGNCTLQEMHPYHCFCTAVISLLADWLSSRVNYIFWLKPFHI